jgi:hypothetical protein
MHVKQKRVRCFTVIGRREFGLSAPDRNAAAGLYDFFYHAGSSVADEGPFIISVRASSFKGVVEAERKNFQKWTSERKIASTASAAMAGEIRQGYVVRTIDGTAQKKGARKEREGERGRALPTEHKFEPEVAETPERDILHSRVGDSNFRSSCSVPSSFCTAAPL